MKPSDVGPHVSAAVRALAKRALAAGIPREELLRASDMALPSFHHFIRDNGARGISLKRAVLMLEFLHTQPSMVGITDVGHLLARLREMLATLEGAGSVATHDGRNSRQEPITVAAKPKALPPPKPERARRSDLRELRARMLALVDGGEKLPEIAKRCEVTTASADRIMRGGTASRGQVSRMLERLGPPGPIRASAPNIGLASNRATVEDNDARRLVTSWGRAAFMFVLHEATNNRKLGHHGT